MAPRKTDFCTCQRSTLRKECSRQSRLIAAVGKISQRYSAAGFDEHNIGKQVKLCSGAVAGRVNQNAELKPLWWPGASPGTDALASSGHIWRVWLNGLTMPEATANMISKY